MKTDEDVTKDQVNEVFAEEKKKDAKREKEHRKRKRRQQAHGVCFGFKFVQSHQNDAHVAPYIILFYSFYLSP